LLLCGQSGMETVGVFHRHNPGPLRLYLLSLIVFHESFLTEQG
jgi:hypothetical protein